MMLRGAGYQETSLIRRVVIKALAEIKFQKWRWFKWSGRNTAGNLWAERDRSTAALLDGGPRIATNSAEKWN